MGRLEIPGGLQRTTAVVGYQVEKLVGLAAIQPDNGQEVLLLLGAEVVYLARDLAVDIAGVDHQHLVAVFLGLGAVQKP